MVIYETFIQSIYIYKKGERCEALGCVIKLFQLASIKTETVNDLKIFSTALLFHQVNEGFFLSH